MSDSSTIVDKVKRRISELEQAIQRLDFVKRHLNQNSYEIKSQIHTSISRHLETLRNREVWLLEQVDTVLGVKEEVLHQQQARLNKALGILHSSLTHATDSGDENAARHLVQALEELNSIELRAEETPYIAYRADHVALRESILNYGRVDAKGMPLQSAFADEDKPSASLPRHVEEYEDSEHHVFYKALQDGKTNKSSIHVTMPKLSSRVEDWLQRPVLQLSTSADEVLTPSSETVSTPVSQSKCAIQNWLSQIKHNPDVEEEDDFEIVDHSGSSQRESPVDEEMKPLELAEQQGCDMFSHIPRDVRQWLVKGSNSKSGAVEEDLRAFFKHIPQDTSMWLVTARRQLENLDELKRGGWFGHIPTETSSWLRRAYDKRVSSVQPAVPDMFSHIPRDKSAWLKKKTPDTQETEEQRNLKVGSEGRDSFLSTATQAPAPLASIPNLMKEYLSTAPSTPGSWLLQQCGDDFFDEPEDDLSDLTGLHKFLKGNVSINAWLSSPVEAETELQPSTDSSGFFSHISTNKSDWLLDGQSRGSYSSPSQAINLKKVAKEDRNEWLRSGSLSLTEKSSTTPPSPIDSLRKSLSHLSISDWLLSSRKRDGISTPSDQSFTVVSSESSSPSGSFVTPSRQGPPLDMAAWIYQSCL